MLAPLLLPLFLAGALLASASPLWAQEEAVTLPAAAEATSSAVSPDETESAEAVELRNAAPVAYIVPIQGAIGKPALYVLRRGLKDAIERGAKFVLLDMDTPGGRADVMLEMMEALERFEGTTATFVNDEAGSAGALLAAVTDEIYFEPTGVMGAAELITSTGADVPEALKRKMTSYINAKVRAYSSSDPRRADVLKAMSDPEYELVLDERVISPKGELLTLTANQALEPYGDPPQPLLAKGIAKSVDDLLATRFPGQRVEVIRLHVTWSESVAQWLEAFSSILLGLGLLALFIEFKTPGFGLFGVVGGVLLLLVFFGHYVAGLSGHEPALVFVLGALLLAIELFLLPGTVVIGLVGVALMMGSLVWSMIDLWPNEPFELSGDMLGRPVANLGLGLLVTIGGALALLRFLPRGWFWDRLVLSAAVGVPATRAEGPVAPALGEAGSLVGRRVVAATALYPSGQVELDGRRYEARLKMGYVEAGTPLVVREQGEFGLIVEPVEEGA